MNTKSLSLLPPTRNLGSDLLAARSGSKTTSLKLSPAKLRKNVADGTTLKVGQSLQRVAKVAGEADVNPLSARFHVAKRGSLVATNPEKNSQFVAKNRKSVGNWPQSGHIPPMPNATPNTQGSRYEEKRHRFYMEADEVALFDKACELNGKSRSEVIARQARSYIRQNVNKLRAAKIKIPAELLAK